MVISYHIDKGNFHYIHAILLPINYKIKKNVTTNFFLKIFQFLSKHPVFQSLKKRLEVNAYLLPTYYKLTLRKIIFM